MNQEINQCFNQTEQLLDDQQINNSEKPNSEPNIITLEQSPQFGLTFGRKQTQIINQLFITPQAKIHTKQSQNFSTSNKIPQNSCMGQMKKTARSALFHQNISKQLDLAKFKQNISKMTYSIKTIEGKNEKQIGVTSRRAIMRNKLLESQKQSLKNHLNSNRPRCRSSSKLYELGDENNLFQDQFQTQKALPCKKIIPQNKFVSKRLNVIKKNKKSSFSKFHQKSSSSVDHFVFCPEETNEIMPQIIDSKRKSQFSGSKITFLNSKTNRVSTVENKRLKYETLMAKKCTNQQNEFRSTKKNPSSSLPFEENFPQPAQSLKPRRQKISLSNLLSQYHTQIIENSNNILIQRSNFSQPLKELFKNKFSAISKTVHNEGKRFLGNSLVKIQMRKPSVSKKQFNHADPQGQNQNEIFNFKKFKKYEELQKENACFTKR